MRAVKAYVQFLTRRAWVPVLLMVILALAAAPFALQLGSTTTDNFAAAPNTKSYTETQDIQGVFPSVFNDRETLYIQCSGDSCSCTEQACDGFQGVLDSFSKKIDKYHSSGVLYSTSSVFNFTGDLAALRGQYYNSTANSMLVDLQFSATAPEDQVTEAVTTAIDATTDLTKGDFKLYLTGQNAARIASTAVAGKALGMTDGIGTIFIVLLFGWQVRSWRLTLIPVFNTILCLAITLALVYPLSKSGAIQLPSYVPSVCLFLSIALSVDYSFFHLSRFQEVRRNGLGLEDAVEEMVTTAGRVVLVSGVVLLFTWLALAAFPVFGTDTLGYCASISIFVCISVNLTLNPALVLLFPKFFGNAAQDPWHCCRRRRAVAEEEIQGGQSLVAPTVEAKMNCYGKVASLIVKSPGMFLVPLVIYALLIPCAIRIFTADLVVGGVTGNTADTDYATSHILADFPGSSGNVPLTVMLSANGGEVKSQEYFKSMCDLANDLKGKTGISADSFHGVAILPQQTDPSQVQCYLWTDAEQALAAGGIYGWSWGQSSNPDNSSTLLTVIPSFNGFGDQAKALVSQGRDAVTEYEKNAPAGFKAVSYHPMAIEVDAEELTASRFVWVVIGTVVVVFVVIALRYRAALIPVKLFFTIALPIVAVEGMAVYVFQDGILNWTQIPSLKSAGGLVWINPVATTFMLIGFALDYDIFLFSRIYADRKSGVFLDDQSAIINAVAATGPVITTAGVIMCLSFSGMIVQSSNPFLSQLGFTMIFGILVDTFVVRTLLVPAFLSMAGRFNWWPGNMPCKDELAGSQVQMA
mmetsp:Transcript_8900/g.18779  ORF Transcript_8900/g.18779 Transcript_8900/m.18779 type:complete len:808 (-) Transcript_8900:284-2707(-)|eukprot:CAMPEP_0204500426 /NCGR_PEP_ID=MMETSP0471-20130131/97142_1 /ASSEMBLY_ACC=CAM_ASM_000602 /TAXON_ID=2969 /ORGANISM="Oxyrrhis marina" /LENGTH=807 /DNA_ID=CAMNT_0051505043 /DNA_START=10 /DNA_END=2433 /DNA_ORIENTATION=-